MAIVLNKNKVLTATENMITSQTVFADNQKASANLADRYRTEGSMLGDTILLYAVDILASFVFNLEGNDGDGTGGMSYNILTEFLPKDPEVQAIVLNKARQIPFTTDSKFVKQAFMTEGAFGDWVSVMLQQLPDTKMVYESGLIKTFIGTQTSTAAAANVTVTLESEANQTGADLEAIRKNNALIIGNAIANLYDELEDFSRAFNEYGQMRSYNREDFDLIWNASYLNKIQNVALPVIFHNQGLITADTKPLLAKYFGTKLTTVTQGDTTTAILMEELDYTVAGVAKHGFPGEALAQGTYTNAELTALANKVLKPDPKIIVKLVHKNAVKYMSGFLAATEWFNAQTLRTQHYLTWAFSSPTHVKNYPFITIKSN